MKKEALRVSSTIPVAPTTLYLAWLNAEQHSAMTGGTAKIDSEVGATFTTWNGYVTGKLVGLDLGRRLLMNWRTTDFPREAPDSRVEIFLEALGGSTRVTILHTEVPEGQAEKYRQLWNEKYLVPMRAFFSKYLPDPRKPPPPRRPIPPEDDEEEDEEQETPKAKGKFAAKAAKPAPAPAPSKAALKPAAKPAASVKAKAVSTPPPPPKAAPKAKPAPAPKKAPPAPKKAPPAPKKAPPAPKKAAAKPIAKKPAPKKPAKPAKPAKGKKK